jgi:hypothetical protein
MVSNKCGMVFCEIVWVHDLSLNQGDLVLFDLFLHSPYDFIPKHDALLVLHMSLLGAPEALYLFKFLIRLQVSAANSISSKRGQILIRGVLVQKRGCFSMP